MDRAHATRAGGDDNAVNAFVVNVVLDHFHAGFRTQEVVLLNHLGLAAQDIVD